MTTLELLKQRRDKAEENMDGFRTHFNGLDDYLKICNYITYFSYLKALSNAPYTMNPEKIKQHFIKTAQFLMAHSTEEEKEEIKKSAESFLSNILSTQLTSVREYSNAVSKWIVSNIPKSIQIE